MTATILIVDDQESLRHFLAKSLQEDGYAIQTAGTIAEGWAHVSAGWGRPGAPRPAAARRPRAHDARATPRAGTRAARSSS